VTRAEAIDRLRAWLTERNPAAAAVTEDTPIVERRILSSLDVAHLLLFIEELSGRPLALDALGPGAFSTLATIYTRFFVDPV
jgi:hypothetical protein